MGKAKEPYAEYLGTRITMTEITNARYAIEATMSELGRGSKPIRVNGVTTTIGDVQQVLRMAQKWWFDNKVEG